MIRGSTSVKRLIFIADSSSTTGAGLANLVYNSAGLVWWYFANDLSNEIQVTLATASLGTYTSGGFVAIDNTNMPGWYEIGLPDAALDAGTEVVMQLRGATNMVPVNIRIELEDAPYTGSVSMATVTLLNTTEDDVSNVQEITGPFDIQGNTPQGGKYLLHRALGSASDADKRNDFQVYREFPGQMNVTILNEGTNRFKVQLVGTTGIADKIVTVNIQD